MVFSEFASLTTMADSNSDAESESEALIPPDTPVFGTKQIDIRLDSDGKGIIKIDARKIEYEFTVDGEQVQEFGSELCKASQDYSLEAPPSLPHEAVKVPDGWEGGKVVHTGGGFWCRKWTKPYFDGHIEVIYNITEMGGVMAQAFDSDGFHTTEIDGRSLSSDADEHDALAIAYELMQYIDDGEYDILSGD